MKNFIKNFKQKVANVIFNKRGDGNVDKAVGIIISCVVGALLITGLVLLFNSTILPSLTTKISELFSTSIT